MKNAFHLLRIVRVLIHHNLDQFVSTLHLFRPYTFLFKLIPNTWRRHGQAPRGQRIREALEDLGPVFVKFGQVLSTRPDLLPDDIAEELALLQDKVPPFPSEQSRTIIELALGERIDQCFASFDKETVASASVAQVHYARMHDGAEVVVKVLRPDIEPVINRDIELLYTLAALAEKYWSEGKRLRAMEVVNEFDKTIHDELDLIREAANASQLRINFEGSDIVYVPKVYWDLTRRNVMTMERIYGIPIRDVAAIKAAGIDMRKLAHNGVEVFFTQAFRDGFFHADMHPGNIFVSNEGQYQAVDFGIMGQLSRSDKQYLAENLLSFFHRDYSGVADAHLRAGWVPPETSAEEFEAAIRTVCEPVFAKPISEISFGHFLIELFRVASRFKMPIQPQLILLQKTLLNIEGLGRQLYPQLDLWETAKPYLENWMKDQIGPRAAVRKLKKELPHLMTILPEMPSLHYHLLDNLKHEKLKFNTHDEQLEALRQQIGSGFRRLYTIIAAGTLLIASLIHPSSASLASIPHLGWILVGGAVAIIIYGLWWKKR